MPIKRESRQNITSDKEHVIVVIRNTRTVIKVLVAVLTLFFGWLEFQGVSILPIVSDASALLVLQLAMILYYSSWIAGSFSDLDVEELLLAKPPKGKSLPKAALGLIVFLGLLFGALAWAKTYGQFALVLSAFWVLNIVSWRYLVSKLFPVVRDGSREHYVANGLYAQVERLSAFDDYLTGNWQWWRFCGGGLLVLLIDYVAVAGVPEFASVSIAASADFVRSAAVLAYVVLFEGWIWFKRLRLHVSISLIEDLNSRYSLEPHG